MFGIFSTPDRSNELQQCLDLKWRMKSGYASAFLNEYRGALAKQYDKAYKQTRPGLLKATGDLQVAYFEIADWALVGQAYRAYMSDLRSGKKVGTNIEKVIWAILLMRIDLIKAFDGAFANYLMQEQEKKFRISLRKFSKLISRIVTCAALTNQGSGTYFCFAALKTQKYAAAWGRYAFFK